MVRWRKCNCEQTTNCRPRLSTGRMVVNTSFRKTLRSSTDDTRAISRALPVRRNQRAIATNDVVRQLASGNEAGIRAATGHYHTTDDFVSSRCSLSDGNGAHLARTRVGTHDRRKTERVTAQCAGFSGSGERPGWRKTAYNTAKRVGLPKRQSHWALGHCDTCC